MTGKTADKAPKTTKTALVRSLLEAPEGATLSAICEVTGWQQHSARAALSTLRKAGITIERVPRGETDPESRYRIVAVDGVTQ
jgi:hypothetical protein